MKEYSAHGHDWCSRKIRKQTRQNHTPGRQKHKMCQATTMKKFLAKRSRSYKHPAFGDWNIIFNTR